MMTQRIEHHPHEHNRYRALIERMQRDGVPESEIVRAIAEATGGRRTQTRLPRRVARRVSTAARRLVRG